MTTWPIGCSSRGSALLLAALMWGASACEPNVRRFSVVPHHVCTGTPVMLAWEVAGCPTVTTDPPLKPRSGRTYIPTTTTAFTLTARRWPRKPKASQTEAKVYDSAATSPHPDEMPFSMTCRGDSIVGTLERPLAEWDSRLLVATVQSGEDRTVTLGHDGRAATLTALNPTTDTFDGTTLGGTWTVSAPLLASESCDGTAHRPTDLILVTAYARCAN